MNNDEDQDLQMLKPFKDAIEFLADKLQSQQDRIDNLEDLLCNQLIGGIKGLYDTSIKTSGIESLKTKYGEKISPFESVMPELGIKDWSSELYDHLQNMRDNTPEYNDEHEMGIVDSLVKNLQEKISKIQSATGAKPVAVSATLEKVPGQEMEIGNDEDKEMESGPDNTAELIKAVQKLKAGMNPRDISR